MNKFLLIFIIFLILFCGFLQAQNNSNTLPLPKPFAPEKYITKPTSRITLPYITTDSGKVQYNLKNVVYSGDPIEPTPVIETKLIKDTITQITTNSISKFLSLRGGLGNYRGTYLEMDWTHVLNRRLFYTLYAQHQAWGKGVVAEKLSSQNQQNIRVGATYNHTHSQSKLNLGFTRSEQYLYGYLDQNFLPIEDKNKIQQNFYKWDIRLSNNSINVNKSFGYCFNKTIQLTNTFSKMREILGAFDTNLWYNINDVWRARTTIEAALINSDINNNHQRRTMFQIRSTIQYRYNAWNVQAGFNTGLSYENLNTPSNWLIAPVLSVDYYLNSYHSVYVLVDGAWQRNSLYDFSALNPWITNDFFITNTKRRIEYTAGWRGYISKNLKTNVSLKSGIYNSFYLFVDIGDIQRLFAPTVFGENNYVYIKQASMELEYRHKFMAFYLQQRFVQGYDNYFYSLTNIPSTETKFRAMCKISLRISVELNYLGMGGITTSAVSNEDVSNLPYIADIGAKGEYKLFKNFFTYLSVQNLLNRQYQRYAYYPQLGFNFLIGLRYEFNR